MKPTFILVIAGLATTITAQTLTQCILDCTTSAATAAGCSSITDLECICTGSAYQSAASQCLKSTCTPEDFAAATQLQEKQCAAISPP